MTRSNPGHGAPQESIGAADERAVESLTHVMKQLLLSISRHADRQLRACDLTAAQSELLMKLYEREAATVADLARGCSVDGGSMTRLLDRLEKKGFCRRVRCTADRRVVRVEITPKGGAAAASARGVVAAALNAHLAGFTDGESRDLGSYLRRMRQAGEAMRERG